MGAVLLIGFGTYFGITLTSKGPGNPPVVAPTLESPSPTTQPTGSSPSPAVGSPAWTVEAYFDAINAKDYQRAWNLGGKNIQGGSYSSFVQNFEGTAHDAVTVVSIAGDVAQIELDATQADGTHRYFAGTYTVQNGVIVAADIHSQ